jgi:gas vesicle protein
MRHYEHEEPYVVIEKHSGGVSDFVLGALIGAGVALLFAPRSGRETRADIGRRARAAQDRVRDVAGGVTDQVVDSFEGARTRIEEQIESARSAIVAKKEQVSRAMEAGREAAHQARTDLERRLAETKAAYNAGADVARSGRAKAPVGSNGDADADADA